MSDDVLLAGPTFEASPQSPASYTPTLFAAVLRFLDEWQGLSSSIVRGSVLVHSRLEASPQIR